MMVNHMNHAHPVVLNCIAAQSILRARRNELQLQAWRLGRRAPQYLLRALDALLHAQEHLSAEVKGRPDCWIASETGVN